MSSAQSANTGGSRLPSNSAGVIWRDVKLNSVVGVY